MAKNNLKSIIKVDKLIIDKFRGFYPNSEFSLGDKLTLIAGQNGTSKSTILGLLSQPLGFPNRKKEKSQYTSAYHDIELENYKTSTGKYFKADYSEIFRMSEKFDKIGEHKYTIFVSGKNIDISEQIKNSGLVVTSEERKDQKSNHLRFVTNSGSRKPGEGNFPHPVIYLGLERLRPLAKCEKITNAESTLDLKDNEYIDKMYRRILNVLPTDDISSETIDTGNAKGFYQSIKTNEYDSLGASAGQDNIGQLLTAIVSFRQLKRKLGDRYFGGLLLIDELDVTLHPVSQEILFRVLFEACNELSLQIVATTHSLTLLKFANEFIPSCAKIVYLRKKSGKVHILDNIDFSFIERDLAHKRKSNNITTKIEKTTILFEDIIASDFFKQITCGIFAKYINIKSYLNAKNNKDIALANNVLATLAKSKIPEFQKIIYILDPDSKKMAEIPNAPILSLPGKFPIELLIFNYLSKLSDDDKIWENEITCLAQECFENFGHLTIKNIKIEDAKKWFYYCQKNNFFGKRNHNVYTLWKNDNIQDCKDFLY